MSEFWKKVATTRRDAGAREALGAVYAIVTHHLKYEEFGGARLALHQIQEIIETEMLPKERRSRPPVLSPVAYGKCESKTCKGKGKTRGLYEIEGKKLCLGCRKKVQAALKAEHGEQWWKHGEEPKEEK